MVGELSISTGFSAQERPVVAAIYWAAFQDKLRTVLGPEQKGLAFLNKVMSPAHVLVARDGRGPVGVAGFATAEGKFVGGGIAELVRTYGAVGSLWRLPVLALVDRKREDGVLLLDGLAVSENARGRSVGSALLSALCEEAQRRGEGAIRLDVVDTNPRAAALYRRFGFIPTRTTDLGVFRHLFGFRCATEMVLPLGERPVSSAQP